MLLELRIKNLILIEHAEISFCNGLNILTGETGSGKSAVLTAIRLITGARADGDLVGRHGNHAIVEALISPGKFLDESISFQTNEPVTIRRELYSSGKNRCFINDEQISLNSLRLIIGQSIEIVDQSSSYSLQNSEEQRKILDTFIGNLDLVKSISTLFIERESLNERIEELFKQTHTKDRELSWAKEDLEIIDETNWQSGEEEELTRNHKRLFEMQAQTEKLVKVLEILENSSLKEAVSLLDAFPELSKSLKNAIVEISEIEQSIYSQLNVQEADPEEIAKCEERMMKIEQVKRRFGKSVDLVEEKRQELIAKIDHLENLSYEIENSKNRLSEVEETIQTKAELLSELRKKHAPILSNLILNILITLNLKNAQFDISLQKTPLSSTGFEIPRFLFSANAGQMLAPIEDCASGGELARLLFSLKVALFDKETNDCLIFDEIDSSVGGLTATVLGEKLKTISEKKQVICITHFVQVARFADLHFVVSKQVIDGKTVSKIAPLEKGMESVEYNRMLGSVESLQTT